MRQRESLSEIPDTNLSFTQQITRKYSIVNLFLLNLFLFRLIIDTYNFL